MSLVKTKTFDDEYEFVTNQFLHDAIFEAGVEAGRLKLKGFNKYRRVNPFKPQSHKFKIWECGFLRGVDFGADA